MSADKTALDRQLKRLWRYEQTNQEAALIIAADSQRYPGLMQMWAEAVLSKRKPAARETRVERKIA